MSAKGFHFSLTALNCNYIAYRLFIPTFNGLSSIRLFVNSRKKVALQRKRYIITIIRDSERANNTQNIARNHSNLAQCTVGYTQNEFH